MLFQLLQTAQQYYHAGQLPQAAALYRQVLQQHPQHSEALHALGVIAAQFQQYDEAQTLIQQAILISPTVATFHNSLGNVYWLLKKLDQATDCYQRALSLNPQAVEAYNNLGIILGEQGQLGQAIACFQQVLSLRPNDANAYHNLGTAFSKQHQLTSAISCYQTALTLNPNYPDAYRSLGKAFKDKGLIEPAIQCYRQALQLKPSFVEAHNNLLYTLNFSLHYDLAKLFAEHQQFNQQHALPFTRFIQPHSNSRLPHKRLKIGYVSPDFRKHSLTYFVEPVLANHDHQQFEIFCYYNNILEDEVTRRFQLYADHWVPCAHLSDEALAQRIRQDEIDILIDLMGHTAQNRLLVCARKPAPIQVFNTIGYSNTTGLTTIDYRITDGYIDPPGIAEQYSSETLIRMPASYYCYRPNDNSPPVNPLPASQNGYITFGSFNSYAKLNDFTLSLWATVLTAIPHSKLQVLAIALQDPLLQRELQERFARLGISSERLTLGYAPSTEDTLKTYHHIDIALDPYPFHGATTTCQALWMGVPVITLVGNTPASRAGLSILSAVELTTMIAYTPAEYLQICQKFSREKTYLQQLREGLRQQMQSSPLMDALGFTRYLEETYRQMWGRYLN